MQYPEAYGREVRKYEGREADLEDYIPPLDCRWGDVLFLSPIHPAMLRSAIEEAGGTSHTWPKAYEIDSYVLDPALMAVWIPADHFGGPETYRAFDPAELAQYSSLPERAHDYYRESYARGVTPFLYGYVPHMLYQGSIDLSLIGLPIEI